MKIQQRFIQHLLLGFVIWILLLGITLPIVLEGILPEIGLGGERYEWLVLIVIGIVTVPCILLFGWYFGSPLLLVMKWIDQLAHEDFTPLQEREKMYTRKGKLKMRYRLYQEVIAQLADMRLQLEKAKVERAQVEEAKRDWIAGISHDLKTPLTYIKGYSTLLLNPDYDWSKEEKCNFIQEIDNKGTHMEQLVQDLNLAMCFDGTQSAPIHKTTQNIVAFVQQVLADVSNDLRAQHHHFELKTTMAVPIAFDEHLLQRVLLNIYMNAVIHNEESVNIVTTIEQQAQHVVIYIQDDGIGMTEETKRNLFNRYYRGTTTEQKSEGTGLGMAIVKSLIDAHDGTITVESAVQQGTTFTIILPMPE
ncbi:HAMP domain-containing histidine kinase [Kroppenstedtia pulmonis]|uniref:histidine kinase n=1 Tax=Kroppenstedtia pulmonis TaxID=1380685 RepID=A0A7D3Y3K8_9BACL|nr:HAMP domain-containing sensor histidine kinase [Kroppenstedtia pulmonis]QKG83605.1 HAMP domain-containing histidine kinase [Kroppenstedtia pulmonis]